MNILTFPNLLSRPVGVGREGGSLDPTGLWENITALWKLDEVSDGSAPVTRNDTIGTQHLTDNNTTPSGVGKLGNCAVFASANTEFLSRASEATLQTGDVDWTLAGWFKLTTDASGSILTKYNTSVDREYQLAYNAATKRVDFMLYNGAAQIGSVSSNTFGNLSTGTWYLLVAIHDAVNNLVKIGLNDVFDQAATTGAGGTCAAPFNIGARASSVVPLNGAVDEVGWWKNKALAVAQATALYNGGAGFAYPF